MKNCILIISMLLLTYSLSAQKNESLQLHPTAETYRITKISKPEKPLVEKNTLEIISDLKPYKIEHIGDLPAEMISFGAHPFLAGTFKAYQDHRPIVINPDVIWLLIEQGFSRHINANAEKFRSRLVKFEGKKDIIISVDSNDIRIGSPNSKWEIAFPKFVESIVSYVGEDFVNNLKADFTTTNRASLIASQITVMETLKAFFNYKMVVNGCGISSVIIEGTADDWEKILKRLDFIESFEMEWWTSELRPIIAKILETKQGKLDKAFWRSMVRIHEGRLCDTKTQEIDGWIIKFYPFDEYNKRRRFLPIQFLSLIAPEFIKVPFIAEDQKTGVEYKMEFWSGMFGASQDHKDFKMKTQIGWIVVHQ